MLAGYRIAYGSNYESRTNAVDYNIPDTLRNFEKTFGDGHLFRVVFYKGALILLCDIKLIGLSCLPCPCSGFR
jgi:hypothetical protein